MAKFCFYIGDGDRVIDRLRSAASFCWGVVEESTFDSFHLFIAADDSQRYSRRTESFLGAISGYAERCGISTPPSGLDGFFAEISNTDWPLNDEWTGSFSAVVYSSVSETVTLCNDLLGHLPLYYSREVNGLLGATSMIVLGQALDCDPDVVGVLQRITPPFCNYGRRTLLKKVYRLLPGERLKWKSNSRGVSRDYDDTLYSKVDGLDLRNSARAVFDCMQAEIDIAASDHDSISIATSGGWDSRIVLGGMPRDKFSVNCLTYGGKHLYETHIARRSSEAIGAKHEYFPIENRYFPSRSQLETLVKETESANYFEWFGIIESGRQAGDKRTLLLGDLCESIDGRYMTTFSSRKARILSYIGGVFGKHDVFLEANDHSFGEWCNTKTSEIMATLLANRKHLSADLALSISRPQLVSEIERDLEISFARVRAHAPPFSAMYDELFIWFHRIRFLLGNQITWLSAAYDPISPGLSMRFLRLITTIHPRQRIRKRLMNAIIGLPEFDKLSRIPSSQIPFISSRTPAVIKDAVWGLRSGLDQLMIKRTLKSKNFNGRQRVLRSLDYIKEYRRPGTAVNVKSWFSGRYLKADGYLCTLQKRANLDAWTLINVDIAAPANVSMILDLCRRESTQTVDTVKKERSAATLA